MGRVDKAAIVARPSALQTAVARMKMIAAGTYRVTGMLGCVLKSPSNGWAWFSLTRGNVIVRIDGEKSQSFWYQTRAEGLRKWDEFCAVQRRQEALARNWEEETS